VLLLDTNAVSALLMGAPGIREVLSEADRHALPVIVVGEYRFGLLRSRSQRELEPLLDRLVLESELLVVDDATTRHYAQLREGLRRRGKPLPENDVWIAALSVQHRLAIATLDVHFDAVAGVTRVGW
jgi:predicted nucleic acid-binding protein